MADEKLTDEERERLSGWALSVGLKVLRLLDAKDQRIENQRAQIHEQLLVIQAKDQRIAELERLIAGADERWTRLLELEKATPLYDRADAAEARVRELEAEVQQQSTERAHWKQWCQDREQQLAAANALLERCRQWAVDNQAWVLRDKLAAHLSAHPAAPCHECGAHHGPGNTNTLCPLAANYRGDTGEEAPTDHDRAVLDAWNGLCKTDLEWLERNLFGGLRLLGRAATDELARREAKR